MISAGDFKKGVTIDIEGKIFTIVEFLHVKPGKGPAFVRTKIKNIITGAVLDRTFNPNEKLLRAHIETKEMQYLYDDGTFYYFMDNNTYEQLPIEADQVANALPFMTENMNAVIRFYKGKAFSVAPPNFVVLKVAQADPGLKGDTATNTTKHAVLETGHTLNVPLFVNEGDKIRVDTRTGDYMERA